MFGNFVDFSISPVGSTFIIVGAILAFLGIVVLLIKTLSFDMDGDILRILGIVAFLLGCFLYFYGTAKLVDDTYEHNYNAVKQDIEKESKKESLFFNPKCKAKNKLEMRYQKCFSIQKRLKIKSLPG